MLPWKRHKFELLAPPANASAAAAEEEEAAAGAAAEERGAPQGQGGAGPAAASSEGALLRRVVGQLFGGGGGGGGGGGRRRRQKFRVSREAPSYTVLYLGNATTLQAKGEGCTDAAVGRIWAKSEAGRLGAKMKLTIGPQGLRLAPAAAPEPRAGGASSSSSTAGPGGHLYLLHRVTYCVADPRLPRLFAWVYRHEVKHKAVLLRCHAVLVSKAAKARAMALLLYQTSAAALADFRRLKRRADARRQQLLHAGPDALPPPAPLRRLLLLRGSAANAAAAYKPPVERSRSAPRLGAITEDARGEQLEEERARRHHREDRDDDDALLLPPLDGAPALGALIGGLDQLAIGNDPALLRADLRVTRLLSGESTGSESSIESNGPPDAASRHSPEPDTG
ncbi:protein FAM43A [Heteronotia binoei]|uniref:protein FAM43A n=1 Tax=Heteronotia binoei TaxID=13085 RepID=UPI00292DEEC4|nr:protein FAM43A [Heteronotia binoei]